MTARLYRSRPSEVEAVQWTGDNWDEVREFVGVRTVAGLSGPYTFSVVRYNRGLLLSAGKCGESGWVTVPVGSWIVRQSGDPSDYWPVDPDYFASKYEALTDIDYGSDGE